MSWRGSSVGEGGACPIRAWSDRMSTPLGDVDPDLETVIWAVADGAASDAELARVRADRGASLAILTTLIRETEDALDAVRSLAGDERELAAADLGEQLRSLRVVAAGLRGQPVPQRAADDV